MIPNFFNKEKYVLHYWNLQLYLSLVMKLKKNRVLQFSYSHWIKLYVEFNTQTKTETEKQWWQRWKSGKALYKLMDNAVYSKTKENLRNSFDVRLVSNKKSYLKCTSKSS